MQDARLLISGTISALNNAITGQTIATTNASVLSAYSVDLDAKSGGGVGVDIGEGAPLYFKWTVQTAPSGGTSVTFSVINCTTADLATGTVTTLAASAAVPVASLTAGAWGYVQVPPIIGSNGAEFLGASYYCSGAVAGLVLVGEFTNTIDDPKKFYPSGFVVV